MPYQENTAIYRKTKKVLKECLLNQSVILRIGNIYSDEILFRAKNCPIRSASSLKAKEWQRLAEIIPECLSYFIEKNHITPKDYLKTKGRDYRNTPFWQVYGHADEPCPNYGKKLCRTVIVGRSSVYCTNCQGDSLCSTAKAPTPKKWIVSKNTIIFSK